MEAVCIVGWSGFVLVLITLAYFGGEASYWRMRSREFYKVQQRLIDEGIVKWDSPLLRRERKGDN